MHPLGQVRFPRTGGLQFLPVLVIVPPLQTIMNFKSLLTIAVAVAAASLLPSCSNMSLGGSGLAAYHAYDRPTKLPSNPNNVRVKVSLSKQRTYVMEGSQILLAMPVSIGGPGTSTPSGSFTIFNKEEHHRASTHGYAYSGTNVKQTFLAKKPAGWSFKGTPMPYWCSIMWWR